MDYATCVESEAILDAGKVSVPYRNCHAASATDVDSIRNIHVCLRAQTALTEPHTL
jgi:hypothetical protein